jgi:parallel beta-helix repeat protein
VPATFTVGGTGNYATIQAAINAAEATSGGATVVVNPGTYNESLIINDQSPLTLQTSGTGTVTISAPAHVSAVTIGTTGIGGAIIDVYSNNVTVNGFTVDGTGSDVNAGIRVIKGGSATIKNNTVQNVLTPSDSNDGIGIQVGTRQGGGSAGTAKVNNNTILEYLGAGVLVDGSSASASVKGNTITGLGVVTSGTGLDVAQYGVQVSAGATARVQGNTISKDTLGSSNPNPTSAGVFLFQDSGTKTVVGANSISGNDDGVLVQDTAGTSSNEIQVVNNTVTGNTGFAGILVKGSSYVEVAANSVHDNTTFNGIALTDDTINNVDTGSTNNEVESNDVFNNADADGIYVFKSNNNTINANNAYSNGNNGINVDHSNGNKLWNNFTHNNTFNGIQVLDGDGNSIWLGGSTSNTQDGILLDGATNTTVVGNVLSSNGGAGLHLINSSTGTLVAFNLITSNSGGSIVSDSSSSYTGIDNWTDTPPSKDGTSGASGSSTALTNAVATADNAVSGLAD